MITIGTFIFLTNPGSIKATELLKTIVSLKGIIFYAV